MNTTDTTAHHHAWRLLPAYMAAPHILFIATYYIHVPDTVQLIAVMGVFAATVPSTIEACKHRVVSCQACITSSIDATDHPDRYLPAFRATHLIMLPTEKIAKWTRIHPEESGPVKIGVVMAISLATILSPAILVGFIAPWPWTLVGVITTVWLIVHVVMVHHRYMIWCPMCRDDDGEDEHTDSPTPTPVGFINR